MVSITRLHCHSGESGVAEATRCLDEMAAAHFHQFAVRRLCIKAMERTDRERQLAR